ncbi:L,D-transpeptidase [Komarekiella sp. 'clone 1']|uniref:L,D-transpeptidase n=1 Tax=Komarekiella delphini-convector SJRDD-AB1 TaxID=2593771 RepID=A0AA40VT88_9NOST|nr:L,D-transpeptidase [Komarekiella delphini-convector]MBD6618827.1 L,D-transpeptidase [Komarekiella delphini-convector SJRDD-AB1]
MSSNVYYRSALKFGLISITLLFWFPLRATARTTVEQGVMEKTIISQLNSPPALPSLPSTSERVMRLLLRLKLPVQPTPPSTPEQNIHLLLVLKQRRLYVYQGNVLQASYPVAIGKPKWETPTGKFKVLNMVENPAWENPFVSNTEVVPPGLQNPLGERWIGFWTDGKDEIGFHGTYKRDSVGKAISHGCVRMYNEDVRKLYEIVTIGTLVIVVP